MQEPGKKDVVTIFATLVRWRKLIVYNFLIFSVVAAIVSLLLPKWYTSHSSILPPEEEAFGGLGMLSLMNELPSGLLGLAGVAGPADIYMAILRSRNVREKVIRDLGLKERYKARTMEDALRKFDGLVHLDKTEENIIHLSATAKDPQLAARIAGELIAGLDRVNRSTRRKSAGYTREFIEQRIKTVEQDLRRAAEALTAFQKKHKLISVEEQTKALIQTLANLEGEVALAEVEYNVARKALPESNPSVQKLKFRLEELRKQADKFERGTGLSRDDFVVPLEKIPDLSLQYAFLLRDVEIQKTIYKFLMQQYEQAKIAEAKDTPTVKILDAPSIPERKSKPRRALIVITAAFLSLIVSLVVISVSEYVDRLRVTSADSYQRLQWAIEQLKADLRIKRSRK